ncbi:Leucine-rich repeat receptor protein kinase [Quillaja saponaria]|uniref:Leucine-rich repeat receptor protein kinase n=1 Tax=Quillaja saponaria TaxID=32244 RepID=A0AAD7L3V6_QUISA|nr:Leucine-rich repeat receptor protein kinase [Quillaja saponaria]
MVDSEQHKLSYRDSVVGGTKTDTGMDTEQETEEHEDSDIESDDDPEDKECIDSELCHIFRLKKEEKKRIRSPWRHSIFVKLLCKRIGQYGYQQSSELLRNIDLSSNKVTGNIPSQFTNFLALGALNLSQNYLNGTIPPKIGMPKELMLLDLSRNYLSGDISSSVADLTFLNHLDLAYNNFSGKIPSSTQLQSFNAPKFIGNPLLCGHPLQQKCRGDKSFRVSQLTMAGAVTVQEDEDEFEKWFYTGMGIGFAVGFWAICGSLILKRSWRHA